MVDVDEEDVVERVVDEVEILLVSLGASLVTINTFSLGQCIGQQ